VGVPPAVTGASRSREGAGRMPTQQRAGRPRYIRLLYVGDLGSNFYVAHPLATGDLTDAHRGDS